MKILKAIPYISVELALGVPAKINHLLVVIKINIVNDEWVLNGE